VPTDRRSWDTSPRIFPVLLRPKLFCGPESDGVRVWAERTDRPGRVECFGILRSAQDDSNNNDEYCSNNYEDGVCGVLWVVRARGGIFLALHVGGNAYRDGAGRDGFGGEAEGSEHGVFAYVGSGEDGGVIGDAGVRA
jgi:hypothetical protein